MKNQKENFKWSGASIFWLMFASSCRIKQGLKLLNVIEIDMRRTGRVQRQSYLCFVGPLIKKEKREFELERLKFVILSPLMI